MTDASISLTDVVDADRRCVSDQLNVQSRKQLGQFMTPAAIGRFMASLFQTARPAVNVLDAGAGMGSLLAAYIECMCEQRQTQTHRVSVTAVEMDPLLAGRLRSTLEMCHERCRQAGLEFAATLIERDFIEHAFDVATRNGPVDMRELEQFDAAILNPPYAKIRVDSTHRRLLRRLGIEATNLYAAFVSIAISMLRPGGELVAIVPRSFCNGPYFKPFRQQLVSTLSLRQIHIYESRKQAFRDDAVLQENIILYAVKDTRAPTTVRLSTSASASHDDVSIRAVPYSRIVRPEDPDAFIHITTNDEDEVLTDCVLQQPCTLAQLGLAVSTGRVVDFRARAHLRDIPASDTVPLIYPAHFANGFVHWPLAGHRKPNSIASSNQTRALLIPNGVYVLTKRFTSKEEPRRVVASVYDPSRLPGSHDQVGFENHLNYFHANGAGLSLALARGLAAYLNSTAVDRYFRQFSGHTQVNATDLRSLRYPDRHLLQVLGESAGDGVANQALVDTAAHAVLFQKQMPGPSTATPESM